MARLIKVRIKNIKNSRTHTVAPAPWSVYATYCAEQEDSTHYRLTAMTDDGGQGKVRQIYLTWPVEDCEVVEDTEKGTAGTVGPVRISGGGPNMQQIAKTSDGGSSPYYAILPNEKDAQDIIERKSMNFARGNVFKAAWRMGEKDVASELYDWKKIKWFAEREIARLEKASG